MRNPITFFLFAVWLSISYAAATTTVVGIDASGSMSTYGSWRQAAGILIREILTKGSSDSSEWRVVGNASATEEFKTQGSGVMVFRFASAPKQDYPYFNLTEIQSADDLPSELERSEFQDAKSRSKTNKSLAMMVAAKESSAGNSVGHAILVSDFLVDADLSAAEQKFVNDMESSVAEYAPVTFVWTKDPRVQVKLIIFTPQAVPPSQGHPVVSLLTPDFVDANPQRYILRWKSSGAFQRYEVKVQDSAGLVVLDKPNLISHELSYLNPAHGDLFWFVIGTTEDGQQIKSVSQRIQLSRKRGGYLWLLFVLMLLIGGIALLAKVSGLPKSIENWLKGRKNQEWTAS